MVQNINILKEKNHMIILLDLKKSFGNVQHHFMIKNPERLKLIMIKTVYDKLTINIMLNGQKLKAFLLNIMNLIRLPTLTIHIQLST